MRATTGSDNDTTGNRRRTSYERAAVDNANSDEDDTTVTTPHCRLMAATVSPQPPDADADDDPQPAPTIVGDGHHVR